MPAKPGAYSSSRLTRFVPAAKRGRRGATMVEFALFFMIFVGLTLFLMDFGLAIWTHETLAHAARAGARYAIVHGSVNPIDTGSGDKTIEQVVKANAIGLDPSNITVTTTYPTTNERSEIVVVEARYPYNFVTGSFLTGNSLINLGSESRMVIVN